MSMSKKRLWRITSTCAVVACLFRVVGLIRYLDRVPGDWIGIGLYVVTIAAFAVGAVGSYIQGQRDTDT